MSQRKLPNILCFLSIAFILNFIWELLHYSLYIDLTNIPKFLHIIIASLTDMAIIAGIFLIISLKNKNINWIKKPKFSDYFIIVLLTSITAVLIELNALAINKWQYTSTMPTLLGIGISPLLQLPVTAILTLMIIRFLLK